MISMEMKRNFLSYLKGGFGGSVLEKGVVKECVSKDLPFGRRTAIWKRRLKYDVFLERNIIALPCLGKRLVI